MRLSKTIQVGGNFMTPNTTIIGGSKSTLKPLYEWDFTKRTNLPPQLSLTRLGAATYWNKDGILSDAAIDEARFDHEYVDGEWKQKGLLVEKAGTNYSVDDNWNSVQNATNTIEEHWRKFTRTSVGIGYIGRALTLPTNTRCLSMIVKQGTYSGFNFRIQGAYPERSDIRFKFDTKEVIHIPPSVLIPLKLGYFNLNNIYRVYASNTVSSRNNALNALSFATSMTQIDGSEQTLGDGFFKHIQIEDGIYPTSLIKTNGSAVTRPADNLTLTLSAFTGSVKFDIIRQDTETPDTKWIDFTNLTGFALLSDMFSMGVWMQKITAYDRILTDEEKANA